MAKITSAGFIILTFLVGCDEFTPDKPTNEYVGEWRLTTVRNIPADTIENLQRLILHDNFTYQCTFNLISGNTHDTTGFDFKYSGTWKVTSTIAYYKKIYLINFSNDSMSKDWSNFSVNNNTMYFSNYTEMYYDPNDYVLTWSLIKH